ncbi:MAG: rRNA pseudouridine synthase [Syntrophomonadaceae bacterium]|nr:rRNA pseudouridine synthase [Syntrophomonadaceae bacterium]
MERLQKVLAKAGVASRRRSEDIIADGRVRVNGMIVTEMGTKVDWEHDVIEVDGQQLKRIEEPVYIILNKPVGYVTTLRDPQGRKKVVDLVKNLPQRIYPVGRLDYDTEGLLLMTNDGELAQALTHPRFGVEKTYMVKVFGIPQPHKLKLLRDGIMLEDGPTAPAQVRLISRMDGNALLEIKIHEGRKRQVRRMCQAIGHPVMRLQRTHVGFLSLDSLKTGEYRYLTLEEITQLRKLVSKHQYSTKTQRNNPKKQGGKARSNSLVRRQV